MTNPGTDQVQAAARANIRGYVDLTRGLLAGGRSVPDTVVLMNMTLDRMHLTGEEAQALFVVALVELAAPVDDLSHLDF
jgi:hypothetical protein